LRKSYAKALGTVAAKSNRSGDLYKQALAVLLQSLSDNEKNVCIAAITALGMVNDPECTDYLILKLIGHKLR
jgi:HEAT repeat protein